jgi:tetratricopeptide (TPR) repeat protein
VLENPRIEELRRRVQKDPSSIAFAQLGEEYRRAGNFDEAISTCRTGLTRHPDYLSARVTLGRALIETSQLEAAETELSHVLNSAPDNLAALRGMADIFHRRSELPKALKFYRRALTLAQNDPELQQTVDDIERALGPTSEQEDIPGGLSFAQITNELISMTPAPKTPEVRTTVPAEHRDLVALPALESFLEAIEMSRRSNS